MKRNIDILLDEDGDLMLDENGEPVVGDVTIQNQRLLLATSKGDWKLYPLVGVGLNEFVDDESPRDLMREIRMQLKADGQVIKSIEIKGENINVDAKYPES